VTAFILSQDSASRLVQAIHPVQSLSMNYLDVKEINRTGSTWTTHDKTSS